MLFLDMEKAFDRCSWEFMLTGMKRMGFGPKFVQIRRIIRRKGSRITYQYVFCPYNYRVCSASYYGACVPYLYLELIARKPNYLVLLVRTLRRRCV